jgi:hypothetical protein
VPAKIAHWNFFFAISGVVNQFVIIQYQKMEENIQINLSNDQKKNSDEQFLQAPQNWEKCSALDDHYTRHAKNAVHSSSLLMINNAYYSYY